VYSGDERYGNGGRQSTADAERHGSDERVFGSILPILDTECFAAIVDMDRSHRLEYY
jgi:hypothetical protein